MLPSVGTPSRGRAAPRDSAVTRRGCADRRFDGGSGPDFEPKTARNPQGGALRALAAAKARLAIDTGRKTIDPDELAALGGLDPRSMRNLMVKNGPLKSWHGKSGATTPSNGSRSGSPGPPCAAGRVRSAGRRSKARTSYSFRRPRTDDGSVRSRRMRTALSSCSEAWIRKPTSLARTSWWSEMDSNQRYLSPYCLPRSQRLPYHQNRKGARGSGVGRAGRANGAIQSKRRRNGASPSEGGSRRHDERRLALRRPASKKRQGTKSREVGQRLGSERYGDLRLAPSSLVGATLGRRDLHACTQGRARE